MAVHINWLWLSFRVLFRMQVKDFTTKLGRIFFRAGGTGGRQNRHFVPLVEKGKRGHFWDYPQPHCEKRQGCSVSSFFCRSVGRPVVRKREWVERN